MKYKLFLDDERHMSHVTWVELPAKGPWVIARNYDDFVDTITSNGLPEHVCFDHDLADFHYGVMLKELDHYSAQNEGNGGPLHMTFDYGPERTGFDCAKWLVEYCIDNAVHFPPYVVHSMNPIGSKRINDYITEAKKHLDI